MNRDAAYASIQGPGTTDYEKYLNTPALLACQTDFAALCNGDELQFQIVHQAQELWMKLVAYTLVEIDDFLQARQTNRVLTLFGRVHRIQAMMIEQIGLLETMSPKEYQQIRLRLGNGSGQESPGFRTLRRLSPQLWPSFCAAYLAEEGRSLEQIYDSAYSHCDAYMVAEALAEYDERFQHFRYRHLQLIERTIGLGAKSLKGRPVELLEAGVRQHFFPALWQIRAQMTDAWGAQYGVVRETLREA